ncbi:pyridoxal phosphate-dependent aminotransferase [Salinirubellus salinus]|uniref:Pyridoxal phosphate-dependent aminotransferase n=1 Tax=Salinirubellus salinus TaxID=1364945 RepID=A0A9E7R6R5_9EURY|nr:pyridoxal phosphate-dependent aminotransferase [Salinirubellus salinus]UWM55718.1 pyridoxal phosphate-dependent aminotransferase [Salinirubellus salinus]
MFPRIDYVDWVLPRIDATEHDLGSSDLHPEGPTDSDHVVPPRLVDRETPDRTLRSLVADEYDVPSEQVLVTAGTSSANLLAAATALRRRGGDHDADRPGSVLVEKPGYEPHAATPRGLGANVDRFLRTAETGYDLEPSRIEAATRPDTLLVTVSNRHNPSGRRVSRERLAECAEVAREQDAYLLVDEVYAPYGRRAVHSEGHAFGAPTAAGVEGAVATGSLTKFFGFGSLRIGWLVADESFVEHAREVSVHLSDVARPSRLLGRRALDAKTEFGAAGRDRCARNADLLASFLADHEHLTGEVFEGCPFGFVESEREGVDGDALSEAAEAAGVLVVPGRFFGVPSGVRVALGRPTDEVSASLEAFGEAVADL